MALVEDQDYNRQSQRDIVPHERRATSQAVAHWAAARANGDGPTISEFHRPDGNELGQHYFLLRADPDPRFSIFILCGESLQFDLDSSPVGMAFSESMPTQIRTRLCHSYAAALNQQEPVYDEGAYTSNTGAGSHFRSVFMPICSDRENDPGYVFGAFGCKRSEAQGLGFE